MRGSSAAVPSSPLMKAFDKEPFFPRRRFRQRDTCCFSRQSKSENPKSCVGPVQDRRNNSRIAAFTCTLCVLQIGFSRLGGRQLSPPQVCPVKLIAARFLFPKLIAARFLSSGAYRLGHIGTLGAIHVCQVPESG